MEKDFKLDLELFPKELTLLLAFMNMQNGESVLAIPEQLFLDVDWCRFLQLASHHRVYPVLYTKLKMLDEKWIPPQVIQALYKEYRNNTFQMLRLSAETEHVSQLFSRHNIPTLLLKGPVLGDDLYGDISLRTSRDLDILVPLENLEQAEVLLSELGYVKDDYFQTILNGWKWRHHHMSYFHPQKGVKLEVHWRLHPGPGLEPSFNQLWARKRVSSLTGYPVYFLGREDLFLLLVSHGARHGWSRLRWLADINQITKQKINWQKLILLLHDYQWAHLGGQALILASGLLNTRITEEMKILTNGNRPRRLALNALFYLRQMVNLHSGATPEYVAKYHKRHLISLMSNQQKCLFFMSFFYPNSKDIEILQLPKNFHFLYFPLRPLLWAWRKMIKYA